MSNTGGYVDDLAMVVVGKHLDTVAELMQICLKKIDIYYKFKELSGKGACHRPPQN